MCYRGTLVEDVDAGDLVCTALHEEYMTDMQQMYPNICLGQVELYCVLVMLMTASRQTDYCKHAV